MLCLVAGGAGCRGSATPPTCDRRATANAACVPTWLSCQRWGYLTVQARTPGVLVLSVGTWSACSQKHHVAWTPPGPFKVAALRQVWLVARRSPSTLHMTSRILLPGLAAGQPSSGDAQLSLVPDAAGTRSSYLETVTPWVLSPLRSGTWLSLVGRPQPPSNLTLVATSTSFPPSTRVQTMRLAPAPEQAPRRAAPAKMLGGPLGLLTRSELAEALRVSTRTLDRRRHERGFPVAVRLLGRPRWRLAEVMSWLEGQGGGHAR